MGPIFLFPRVQREYTVCVCFIVNNPSAPLEYPPSLYSAIPIKQLFLLARDREVAYGDLYPTLLRLLTTHYPHLCLVEDWVEEEKEKNTLSSKMPQDVENVASSKETRRGQSLNCVFFY